MHSGVWYDLGMFTNSCCCMQPRLQMTSFCLHAHPTTRFEPSKTPAIVRLRTPHTITSLHFPLCASLQTPSAASAAVDSSLPALIPAAGADCSLNALAHGQTSHTNTPCTNHYMHYCEKPTCSQRSGRGPPLQPLIPTPGANGYLKALGVGALLPLHQHLWCHHQQHRSGWCRQQRRRQRKWRFWSGGQLCMFGARAVGGGPRGGRSCEEAAWWGGGCWGWGRGGSGPAGCGICSSQCAQAAPMFG